MSTDEFKRELEALLNKHSQDARLETPDFVLADYICRTLENYRETFISRQNWFHPTPPGGTVLEDGRGSVYYPTPILSTILSERARQRKENDQ